MCPARGIPVKIVINLTGPDQKSQLVKAGEGTVFKILSLEIKLFE
jgi:hypothetical protein